MKGKVKTKSKLAEIKPWGKDKRKFTGKYSCERIEIPLRIPSCPPKDISATQLGDIKDRER